MCSDIQTHSCVNISHKNVIFDSVLLFVCTSFVATLEERLHVLVLLFSFEEENSYFYHIFALLYFFPSYISFLRTLFRVVFLSAYEVLYGTFYSTLVAFLA